MIQNEQDWKDELQHLIKCKVQIRSNIVQYEKDLVTRHALAQELHKAINSGDVELYNQLMTATSLEAHAANELRKNMAALDKPYFGRIDYVDSQQEEEETVYIGKNGVSENRVDVMIADWRAPISSVYYENGLGTGEYQLPDSSSIAIDLKQKRTYDISDGTLYGYYDSDVTSNDELLIKYLSQNKDAVLGEIISTIQKEQNAIIRESPFANLIVQGVAGSGKTTVAMHRISYLLFNYKERFVSNEYCIVGSNDLLLNYITSGLPELDVPDIKHMRMEQLLIRLCEKDWLKKNTVIMPDETAALRCTLLFMQELEVYLMEMRENIVNCEPLIDSNIGTILSYKNNLTLLQDNPSYSINRLLTTMDDRVKTRIKFLLNDFDYDKIQKMLKKYAKHYKYLSPKSSIYTIYTDFLMVWSEEHGYDISAHMASCQRKQFDLYDIAALSLIHYRVTQKKPNEEFGLLFLDEAQDFGLSIYYALKNLLPNSYFTIMGDVSQNINYDTGINDWYDLNKLFLTNQKDKFLMLQKSYRNTIEISEYASRILDKASLGRYKIQPVIRHGIPVCQEHFWSDIEIAERVKQIVDVNDEKGYTTTAIICKTEEEAAKTKLLLSPLISLADDETQNYTKGTVVLPIRLVKGLEFDVVVLWNLDIQRGMELPQQAKLLYVAATRAMHELYEFNC